MLEQFDFNKISSLVDRVEDMWTPPEAEESFRRIYAEAIIRCDMHFNNMQFQLTENNELMAIACASRKGDEISAEEWWNGTYKNLSPQQQSSFNLCRDYLSMMDKKVYKFMKDDDVKLDLFISTKKGWGKKILDEAILYFKQLGFKNLFLWTDCECNVDWYFSHGYELIDEDVYEPFSTESEEYKMFIFKKKLTQPFSS
ncbi:MAG: hypothetical protein MJ162_03550 [Treponema sp.]|nr:hypothetical protein [Treponema sp.]